MDELIRRQAMKDMITNHWSDFSNAANYRTALACVDAVPTSQSEIIYCKDCKHRDPEDKKCDCGHDILWQLPRQDDWFCADAERREVPT